MAVVRSGETELTGLRAAGAEQPRRPPSVDVLGGDRVLDGIGEPLVALDGEWRVSHWNAGAERLTGRSRASVLGRDLRTVDGTFVDGELGAACRDAIRRREPRELCGWRVPGADAIAGPVRLHDVRITPLDDGGLVILFVAVGDRGRHDRELIERSSENEALRRLASQMAAVPDSAALLRLLCESAREQAGATGTSVLRVSDGEGHFVGASGCLEQVLGRRMPMAGSLSERFVRSPAAESIATPAYHSGSSAFNDLAESLGIGPMLVMPLRCHGQLLGVLSVARPRGAAPFTERDRAKVHVIADHASLVLWKSDLLEQTQAANEAKAKFLASVSHELRTPLAALAGYGELLGDQVLGTLSESQLDAVERMRGVTNQLTLMIDEILAFTALDGGRERVSLRPASPEDLLAAAAGAVENMALRKGLRFRLEIEPSAPAILTDPDKTRQILVQLAGNAVKFTDRGEVVLALRHSREEVRFEVRDTGIGIAREAFDALFLPFSQLDGGLTRRHGGTGLGLYIARRLAEMLCGRIDLESEPGKGSTFTLVLPAGS